MECRGTGVRRWRRRSRVTCGSWRCRGRLRLNARGYCTRVHTAVAQGFGIAARLLGDALQGNSSLFTREDGVEETWRIVQPCWTHRPPVEP